MPKGYEDYSLLTAVMVFYLFKVTIQGLGVGAEPRYFGAKSDRDCGLLTFQAGWLMAFRWPLMLGIAILGLFLVNELFPDQAVLGQAADMIKSNTPAVERSQWPDRLSDIAAHPQSHSPTLITGLQGIFGDNWAAKLNLLSYDGTVNPERILPAVILFKIPMGLRGILVLALFAAAMSAMNCSLNFASSFWTRDIYQAFIRPKASSRELMNATYIFGITMALAALYMAYFTKSINDIWSWITAGLISGLMVPFALRFYWWRFNGSGFAIGTMTGMTARYTARIHAQYV